MLQRDFKTTAYSVSYQAYEQTDTQGRTTYIPITEEKQSRSPWFENRRTYSLS